MNTYNELQALKLLADGNEKGFKMIYDRYSPGILRIGRKFLRSQTLEAEDLVQEVFTRIWMQPNIYTKAENLEAYLFLVTKNLCIRKMKKLQHEKIVEGEYAHQKDYISNNVENFIYTNEYEKLVQQAIDKLPLSGNKFTYWCV